MAQASPTLDLQRMRQLLDDPESAAAWLRPLGIADSRRAHTNLVKIATSGVTLDLLAVMCEQLSGYASCCADPDMALNNLEQFVAASRNPLSLAALFERDPHALPTLLQILSTSQHFSNLLVNDPESFDLLRLTEGAPVAREALVQDIVSEVSALEHEAAVMRAIRRFKHREMLRIAYGDIIREHSLQTVTTQISYLADALLEAALAAAWKKLQKQRGTPRGPDGRPARLVILAMGKLGGSELNYSSDIDLIFLYDVDGRTDSARPVTNQEFFDRLVREVVNYLAQRTELGAAYRVDLRLRPDGERGPSVLSKAAALHYYDIRGRTWERQAYIKARAAAGDESLGREFLDELQPWIYRRYLSRADISGIKALKHRIEEQTKRAGVDVRDVKTGHGGIRDIEFVIQFLQLLNGGDLPALRTGTTLEAIVQLEHCGCLSNQERLILAQNYAFLRKIEHRLQIMFDLQTHALPKTPDELRKLAMRMGYTDSANGNALEAFEADFRNATDLNRRILDHLLNDAFGDEAHTEAEVDLVLDPDPPEEKIAEVLGRYRFRDAKQAYRNLMALAEEKIRFLSTRRCRHFLASIAPQLLRAIDATPDPDSTLINLGRVSDSLGGKGVLWELFSFNPPTLKLYVELCAYSAYLSGILTSTPGMLDSLMDSLVLDKLPSRETLERMLAELCWAAEDIDPILHSFKNDQQLCVGVRDLLGKEDIVATTAALSNIAEVSLAQIAAAEYDRLVGKFGVPTVAEGSRAGQPCELVILGMGKFGGREMSYHSDVDLIFLYEAEGNTAFTRVGPRNQSTSNQHFFSELAQRIIRTTGRLGANGRLYEIDARLRPTGQSGALAVTFDELARYFQTSAQLWERQALCKARVVYGSPRATKSAMAVVNQSAFEHRWHRADADEVRRMRHRVEEAGGSGSVKRGPGGIVDIEFLVQMLQLKHGRRLPRVRTPNTLEALASLAQAEALSADDCAFFTGSYRFLRTIEGRLRLINSTARDKLPEDRTELAKLAHLMGESSPESLLADYERCARETRARFDRIFDAEGAGG